MRAAWGLDRKEQGQEEYLTPVERSLKARLDQTEQTLSQLQRTQQTAIEQEQQSAQMARVSEVRNELQSFINETKDGKPAHPYVERVAPAIAGIIRGGLVKQVDDYGQPVPIRAQMAQAYKMACDLDPSIRTAAPSPRQAKRVRSAQDVDVVTNHPAGTVNVPGMSIDEVLEAQYEKLSRRG